MASACPPWAVLGEEIPAAGQAQPDIITTVYRRRLTERVTTPPEKSTHPSPGASAT